MKTALYIYNPVSGKGKAGDELSTAIEVLAANRYRTIVRPTLPGQGPEKIIASELGNFDIVICAGGDGTLNHTINGLMAQDIKSREIAYFPAGSINDFAHSVGINKGIRVNALAAATAQPFFYDIGKFGDRYFNYAAGFGYFTSLSYTAPQELKNIIGHSAYYLEAFRHIPIGEKYHAKITLADRVIEDDFALCIIANSFRVAGFSVLEKDNVELDDGIFEMLLIKAPKGPADMQKILGALITQDFDGPYIHLIKMSQAHFEFEDEIPWVLDGEYGGTPRSVFVSVVPKAIGIRK